MGERPAVDAPVAEVLIAAVERLWQVVSVLEGDFRHALALLCLDNGIPQEALSRPGNGQDEDEWNADVRLARELRQAGVADLALLAAELDEKGRAAVMEMLEYVRRAQGASAFAGCACEGPDPGRRGSGKRE